MGTVGNIGAWVRPASTPFRRWSRGFLTLRCQQGARPLQPGAGGLPDVLADRGALATHLDVLVVAAALADGGFCDIGLAVKTALDRVIGVEIGRASCRERGCQYV